MTALLKNGTISQLRNSLRLVPLQRRISAAQALTSPPAAYNLFDVEFLRPTLLTSQKIRESNSVQYCRGSQIANGPQIWIVSEMH